MATFEAVYQVWLTVIKKGGSSQLETDLPPCATKIGDRLVTQNA